MRGTEQTAHRRPKRAAVCVAAWLRISSQLVSLKIGLPGGPPARRQSREWCSPLGAEYSPSLPVQAGDYQSCSRNDMNAKREVRRSKRRVRRSAVVDWSSAEPRLHNRKMGCGRCRDLCRNLRAWSVSPSDVCILSSRLYKVCQILIIKEVFKGNHQVLSRRGRASPTITTVSEYENFSLFFFRILDLNLDLYRTFKYSWYFSSTWISIQQGTHAESQIAG